MVAVDLKGFGESDKPWRVGGYSDQVILAELRALVAALQGSSHLKYHANSKRIYLDRCYQQSILQVRALNIE